MNAQPRWLDDEEQQLWRLMLAGFTKISRTIDDRLQAGGDISSPEFSVLVALSEAQDHTLRLRELCEELGWDRSRASHQVTRMKSAACSPKRSAPATPAACW